jgi:hypothetical protein
VMWPFNRRNARAGKSPAPTAIPSVSVAEVLAGLQRGEPLSALVPVGADEGSAYAPPEPEPERPWTADEMREVVEREERHCAALAPRLEACWAAGDKAALRLCATLERLEHLNEQVEQAALKYGAAIITDDKEEQLAEMLLAVRVSYRVLTHHVRNVATALHQTGLEAQT